MTILAVLNQISWLPDWGDAIVLPVVRWLHIVATATLVGGAFFYEFVIPKAIEDLNTETQLAVLGRVRWIFRRVVNFSAITLIITGIISTWRMWPSYHKEFAPSYPWWVLHVGLGVIALIILVRLTIGDRVPRRPFIWLRVVFVVMLVTIFAATVARHIRLSVGDEWTRYYEFSPGNAMFPVLTPMPVPTTQQ